MTVSSEINVFDEGLDFCVLFCLGVLPLWILGLICQSHRHYVVHPHGWARSTLTGSILTLIMDTTLQSMTLNQLCQWWVGQSKNVFFRKSGHLVGNERVYTYIYISERPPRGTEFFLREVTDVQCVFCRMHFGESRTSGVGKLGSWGLEVSGSWGVGKLGVGGLDFLYLYMSVCLLVFPVIYLSLYLSIDVSICPFLARSLYITMGAEQTDRSDIHKTCTHTYIHTYIHAMRPRMNDLSVWSRKPKEDSQAWGSSLDIAWESNDLNQEIWRGPMDAFLAECFLMLQERDQQIWIAPVNTHHLPGRFWHLIEIIQRTWGGHFGVARIRHALEAKGHEPKNTEAF